MLKIISPKGHKYHQPAIESFLDLLRVYQDFELSLERRKNATFLIAEDRQHGVYGGALLYPQKINEDRKDNSLKKYENTFHGAFVTFQPQIKEFWITQICYCLEVNLASPEEDIRRCENFYEDSYEAFLQFGQPKGLEFLALSLCSFETIEPPLYESWPDIVPVRHSDATDGLFHGILPLKGARFLPKVPRKRSKKDSSISTGSTIQ